MTDLLFLTPANPCRNSLHFHFINGHHHPFCCQIVLAKENIKLNETISNQKIIIARLQRENDENLKLIAHLTKKIEIRDNPNIVDLLNFD